MYLSKTRRDHFAFEQFYSELFLDKLNIDPSQGEFVLTEFVLETEEGRFKMLETMFETFGASKVALEVPKLR